MNGLTRHQPGRDAMTLACFQPRRHRARTPVAVLIDGEPGQAGRHVARLRADGYAVAAATGLEAGMELAAARRPDLVFVCLGAWAVPALVVLALRADPATRGLPTVLVADRSRTDLAREVGGLLPTEQVVPRRPGGGPAGLEAPAARRDRPCRRADRRRRPGWSYP
jgi:hypothetical protein